MKKEIQQAQKPTKGSSTPARSAGDIVQEPKRAQIEALAYQLWLDRGCPVGSPEVDWFEAEVRQKSNHSTVSAA
jgi:DUF2934 family protein